MPCPRPLRPAFPSSQLTLCCGLRSLACERITAHRRRSRRPGLRRRRSSRRARGASRRGPRPSRRTGRTMQRAPLGAAPYDPRSRPAQSAARPCGSPTSCWASRWPVERFPGNRCASSFVAGCHEGLRRWKRSKGAHKSSCRVLQSTSSDSKISAPELPSGLQWLQQVYLLLDTLGAVTLRPQHWQ